MPTCHLPTHYTAVLNCNVFSPVAAKLMRCERDGGVKVNLAMERERGGREGKSSVGWWWGDGGGREDHVDTGFTHT